MRILFMLAVATLLTVHSYAGTAILTQPQIKPDYYVWITSISSGPIEWVEMSADEYGNTGTDTVTDRFFRVVVTNAEIYNTVYIEEITRGEEGCCVRLGSIRKMDLGELKSKFSLLGEVSGFTLTKWNSSRSFNFTIGGREFVAKDIGNAVLNIEEILATK